VIVVWQPGGAVRTARSRCAERHAQALDPIGQRLAVRWRNIAMLGFQRNFRTALGGYVCNTRKLLLRIQEKQLVRIQPSLRMLKVRLQL
jgi:hypothetical protein